MKIFSAVVLSVIAAAGFLVLPIIQAGAGAAFSLNDAQTGWLGSAAMAGAAISAGLALFLVRRFPWHPYALIALAVQLGGLYLAFSAEDINALLIGITVSSLGGGAAYSLALTMLSDSPIPERSFSFSVAAQVAFQVCGFLLGPSVLQNWGFSGLLMTLMMLVLICIFLVPLLPTRATGETIRGLSAIFYSPVMVMALLGCLAFFFNVGVVWAYVDRIATMAELAPTAIGQALALGVACGIAGSLAAGALAEKIGARAPLTFAALGTVASVVVLDTSMSLSMLYFSMILYNFVWNFSLTYQYAVIARVDTSERCIAVVPAFHALGASLGPAIAALLVDAQGLIVVPVLASLAVLLSLALMWPVAARVQSLNAELR